MDECGRQRWKEKTGLGRYYDLSGKKIVRRPDGNIGC